MIRLAAAAVLLVAGCKEAAAPAPKPAETLAEHGLRSVEQDLWAAAKRPEQTRFRGVSAWTQAQPQHVAVCGQVNAFADDPSIFVPFVSVVTLGDKAPDTFEHIVATTPGEASRLYVAAIAACYEGGGRPASALHGAPPTPPLPDAVAAPAAAPAEPPPTAAAHPTGDVTVRQAATIHADPHGAAVRTAPRGAVLHVFSQAPGGWFQIGDSSPWGWVHESMLDRH